MWWLLACTSEPPPALSRPDVLLVVLDTVRADHLATYGYERDTSYQLDAVAAAGVVFEDVTVSGTWTWPGHAALFTGEPPWITGAHYVDVDAEVPVQRMRTDLPTLAERFAGAGYTTVSHSTNRLLDPEMGLVRGFQTAEIHETDAETVAAATAAMRSAEAPLLLFVNLLSAHAPYFVVDGVPWSGRHRQALEGAEEGTTLGTMRVEARGEVGLDPGQHCEGFRCDLKWTAGNWEIRPEELAMIADLYDGNLVQVDHALKTLIGAWDKGGVVAVTSDHGEFLGEHRMLQHRLVTLPPVLEIPLVVVGPGLEAGGRVSTPVQLLDLYPTLLEMAGIAEPEWSLSDAAAGVPRPGRIEAAAWPDPRLASVPFVAQRWGYVREGERWGAASGGLVVGDEGLAEEARAVGSNELGGGGLMSEEHLERLRALGYL
ncbi:MAG TPA: sulfatase [Myxococcota bacterium]|nr:sulfatase [Myxococcota bacterium]